MPSRRRSRERALQVLFNWDNRKCDIWRAVDDFYETLHSEEDDPSRLERDGFMEELVLGATTRGEEIDKLIVSHSSNWRIERMPSVDRNVLRLATFEMLEAKLPVPLIIDEALELVRRFSGDESVSFVNGVLDAIRRELFADAERGKNAV
jgi:transcription antitermination protein NusB